MRPLFLCEDFTCGFVHYNCCETMKILTLTLSLPNDFARKCGPIRPPFMHTNSKVTGLSNMENARLSCKCSFENAVVPSSKIQE